MSKLETVDILAGIITAQKAKLKKVDEDNFDEFYSGLEILPNTWKANYMAEISSGITFLESELNNVKGAIQWNY